MMFALARRNMAPPGRASRRCAPPTPSPICCFPRPLLRRRGGAGPRAGLLRARVRLLRARNADGVVHAELFFDPQTHTARGVALGDRARRPRARLRRARSRWGIGAPGSCASCAISAGGRLPSRCSRLRRTCRASTASASTRPSAGIRRPSSPACSRAAASSAFMWSPMPARRPPAYIADALDLLKARRIDHGVRCTEDRRWSRVSPREQMPLTVCPLSNVQACACSPDLTRHEPRAAARRRAEGDDQSICYFPPACPFRVVHLSVLFVSTTLPFLRLIPGPRGRRSRRHRAPGRRALRASPPVPLVFAGRPPCGWPGSPPLASGYRRARLVRPGCGGPFDEAYVLCSGTVVRFR